MIQYKAGSEDGEKFKKLFTVENKNIEKLERVMKRKMPRARWIKLYIEEKWQYLFPIGRFNKLLTSDPFSLCEFEWVFPNFKYEWTATDEQQEILDKIKDNRRTGLIVMKTWRWKSHIIMQIVNHFRESVIILTHNLATLKEMKEKFKEVCWVDIGEYHWWKKNLQPITVCTHQSFMKKFNEIKTALNFQQVIFDEADSSTSTKMLNALIKFDPSSLFWLTGTPKRNELDGEDLQLLYGKMLKCEGQKNNWYNIIPNIERIKYSTSVYSYENNHDMREQLAAETNRIEKQRLFIIEKIVFWDIKYWLLLVDRKELESEMYYSILSEHINCVLINWDTKRIDDEAWIKFIEENWGLIIGTLKKMWRWVDIPFIDWIFVFFPNRFHSLVIQAVGRWLRKHDWKKGTTVYDWIDQPIWNSAAADRMKSYRQEYPWCVITDFTI